MAKPQIIRRKAGRRVFTCKHKQLDYDVLNDRDRCARCGMNMDRRDVKFLYDLYGKARRI